jgi:2-oxoglutarate dehydrogenase E2 component (dihydrolipoamide succinyltransferase)
MNVEIIVPSFGESVSEAIVVKILKPTGSFVKKDEEIVELETDKINAAIVAPESGEIQLSIKLEDRVKIGQKIGHVDASKKQTVAEVEKPKQIEPKPVEKVEIKPVEIPASADKFIIQTQDYLQSLGKKEEPKAPIAKTQKEEPTPIMPGERRKMTSLRKTIAKRLVDVKNQTAMLTTFNEADMTEIMAIRAKEQDDFVKKHGVKLGFMSFFVKAVVSALKAYPQVNAYIDGEDIVSFSHADISVAVSTDKGLMVPVIRSAETLSFAQIEQKIADLSKKGREGKLAIGDLQGGSFTITNGGVFGSLLSTPILNPPQSAILGMHTIQKRPVAINDQVVIRPMMYLALSYDHRIIDGKEAVGFLVHVKEMLEDPHRFVLDF